MYSMASILLSTNENSTNHLLQKPLGQIKINDKLFNVSEAVSLIVEKQKIFTNLSLTVVLSNPHKNKTDAREGIMIGKRIMFGD